MAAFREATYNAIFGNKKVLRPGEDDEKLLQLLESGNSDIEISDDEDGADNIDYVSDQQDNDHSDEETPVHVESSDEDDEEDILPLSVLRDHLMAMQTNTIANSSKRASWKRTASFKPPNFEGRPPDDNFKDRADWTSKEYLSMYFKDEVFQKICDCTNAKSVEIRGVSHCLTLREIKQFFGILTLMSCLKYPRIRMYWAKTTKVPAIATVMRRDRFFSIRSLLKVVVDGDVSEEVRKSDKFWKVRPIMDIVRNGCLLLPRENVIAVDEQMIPFTGVCAMKQFVRGKPNPEGLKNFVCAAPDGLVIDFELYQGKNTFPDETIKNLGVGPSAVVRLSQTLLPGSHLYFDRYFTTIPLLDNLYDKKMYGTGTIMKSRISASVHLTTDKMMSRMVRGTSEQLVRQDGRVVVVKWYDMKPVLLTSTGLGIHPVNDCRRWSKKESKYIQIPRPNIVLKYNNCMGGIDLIDRMISYYRIQARCKKWTVRVILHFFDLAMANSWILYRRDKKSLNINPRKIQQYLDFKIEIASYLLSNDDDDILMDTPRLAATRANPDGRAFVESPIVGERKKRQQHFPEIASSLKNSVRCKNRNCNKKTKFYCDNCEEFLCITGSRNCFKEYHTK